MPPRDIAGGGVAAAKMMAGLHIGDREGFWGTQNDRAFDMGYAERSAVGNYVGRDRVALHGLPRRYHGRGAILARFSYHLAQQQDPCPDR
jgi:hypothetical protein